MGLKILGLITNIEEYQIVYIIMSEENISQEFRLKIIDETRNWLTEEINQNWLMSKQHKKVYRVLNYIEHLLILISTLTGCVSVSTFVSLVSIPIGITSPATGLTICLITAAIKKYKSIIKKKKHDKILSLPKSKLNSVQVFNKVLIDSNIIHREFVLMNNALKEFDNINKEIIMINKSLNYIKQCYLIVLGVEKIQK